MALIVYNRENSRPQEVTYKGKRTINLDSRGDRLSVKDDVNRIGNPRRRTGELRPRRRNG